MLQAWRPNISPNSSIIWQKGESQNGCFKKTRNVQEMFVFWKIWRALFSCWNTRFEIRPFCLITDELCCLIYDSQTNLTDRTSIPRPANLLKKRLWHRCFPVNFAKFLSTPFLQNGSGGCFCTDISKLVTICHYCLLFHVDKILNLHHN